MNIRRLETLALALVVASIAAASSAVDAVWSNTGASGAWTATENWKMPGGEAVSAAPVTMDDTAAFPAADPYRRVLFNVTRTTAAASNYALGTLTGDHRTTLVHYNFSTVDAGHPECTLTLGDPNGFTGYWESDAPSTVFAFGGPFAGIPVLNNLSALFTPIVTVEAGKTAAIGETYGVGALVKRGAGELRLDGSLTGRDRIYVQEGGLTFGEASVDPAILASALGKALFHLDASVASSLVTETDGAGETIVTRWNDLSGSGEYAYAIDATDPDVKKGQTSSMAWANVANPRAPLLSDRAVSATGLALVDFGSNRNNTNSVGEVLFGPSNCMMRLSKELSIKEAFYVSARPNGGNSTPVLGHIKDLPFYAGSGMLFHSTYAFSGVAEKDIRLDGRHVAQTHSVSKGELKPVVVTGVALSDAVSLNLLACDRLSSERVGGMQVGEVLLFAEKLTEAERVALTRHLRRKWSDYAPADGGAEVDAGAVMMASGTTVGVAAGKTARVAQLTMTDATLVKTGAGTLVIDCLHAPEDVAFDVRGGSIQFGKLVKRPDGLTPPANPFIRLDASKGLGADGAAVMTWNDADGNGRAATCTLAEPKTPKVTSGACNGLDAVDFGHKSLSFCSCMTLPDNGQSYAYAAFMVIRPNVGSSLSANIFGSSTAEFYRSAGLDGTAWGNLQSAAYRSKANVAAAWSVNGRPVDPKLACPLLRQTSEFFVIGLSASQVMRIDQLFKDRKDENNCGGFQLGEFLLYDRPLSESETLAAEAYLMKKWLKKDHPVVAGVSPRTAILNVSPTSIVEVGGDDDLEIDRVNGGNGNLVKDGPGKVTLTVDSGAITSFDVTEGILKVRDSVPDAGAVLHLDAADAKALTTYADPDGATRVTRWADARRNGIVATSTHIQRPSYYFAVTNPVLKQVAINGVSRPSIHFGQQLNTTTAAAAHEAGTLPGDYTASSFELPACYAVRELFTVYADNREYSSTHWGFIGGTVGGNDLDWNRNSAGIYGKYAPDTSKNGYIAVDGVVKASTDNYPAGFHVVSLGPTAACKLQALCQDRNCNAGGGSICEQIAFGDEMTSAQRQEVEKYLTAKWMGATNGVNSVADTEFTFRFNVDGELAQMEYDGFLDFTDGASFAFTAPDRRSASKGDYPFLTVRELRGYGVPPTVTLDENLAARFGARVELRGNTFYLVLEPKGLLFIVR